MTRILSVSALSLLSLFVGAPTALANPFEQEMVICQGLDGDVVFEILVEKPKASAVSTPRALAMRISDPTVSPDREEIALFDAQDKQLTSEVVGTASSSIVRVTGVVDLKNPLTGRKGERVGGTVLGALHSITVDLEMDFDEVVTPRKRHAGIVTYLKKNGEELTQDLDCRRQK
jgi:hypothetical protein